MPVTGEIKICEIPSLIPIRRQVCRRIEESTDNGIRGSQPLTAGTNTISLVVLIFLLQCIV